MINFHEGFFLARSLALVFIVYVAGYTCFYYEVSPLALWHYL